ncbi:MAG: lipoate--protein ligase family protein, partial [Pirellulales bacterium]|nr:lipoate--protein ligase family protein [Pirellulales bacterium]
LKEAPRQPQYRAGRDHRQFVTNVPVDPEALATGLAGEFGAVEDTAFQLPQDRIRQLKMQRYDDPAWHFRH